MGTVEACCQSRANTVPSQKCPSILLTIFVHPAYSVCFSISSKLTSPSEYTSDFTICHDIFTDWRWFNSHSYSSLLFWLLRPAQMSPCWLPSTPRTMTARRVFRCIVDDTVLITNISEVKKWLLSGSITLIIPVYSLSSLSFSLTSLANHYSPWATGAAEARWFTDWHQCSPNGRVSW